MWKYLLAGAKSVAMPGRTYQLDADGLLSEPEPVNDDHAAWFTRSKDWTWIEPELAPADDSLAELHAAFDKVAEADERATRMLDLADRLDAELAPAPEHQGFDGFEVHTAPDATNDAPKLESHDLSGDTTSSDVVLGDEPQLPPSVRPKRRRKE